tara:strand:- start:22397 stop:23359 length:963 start_codon:yes stop_codon:yes gene_type:complete
MHKKVDLIKSSKQLKRCIDKPKKYALISIDNLAFTIPVPKKLVKQLYKISSLRTADVSVKLRSLDYHERYCQKYKKKFLVSFSNGSTLSVFCYGLNEKMNQVKIEFNPNTVGYDNIDFIFNYLRELFGEQRMFDWLQRSKVTSIHYAVDFPFIPFRHIVVDYAYSPKYESFSDVDSGTISTIRFGNKSGCPIIIYDKVCEQKGSYRNYSEYVRLEKQHRPQQRGRKSMFTLAELDKQKYSFQGIIFYDPNILNRMPDRVLDLIREYGIGRAKDLLQQKDKVKLLQLMVKYRLPHTKKAKAEIVNAFQLDLLKLKNLILKL